MNTKGHKDVADSAGFPLLQEAFGKDKRSLTALYLGNWLTDVSQAVDPVAYWSGSEKFSKSIDGLLDEILSTTFDRSVPDQILRPLRSALAPLADDAKQALKEQLDFFFQIHTDERDSRFAQFFRSTFLVVGYFKFVHPDTPKQAARMNFECFMRVFGRASDTRGSAENKPANDRPGAYTQYYPHEHFDRPECLPPQTPPHFAPGMQVHARPFRVARGKQPGTRSPRRREQIRPDLYSYLRDDIEMTAGLLAELDLAFQQAFVQGIKDDDPEWHITLAKLGHALHQVEDFFAHSNWVELVVKRLGPEFRSKILPPHAPIELINYANTIYEKRLRHHLTVPHHDWHEHKEENWVVTGYFDFQDTLISLAHLSEELWGGHVPDPFAAGHDLYQAAKETVVQPKTALSQVQTAMRETLDLLTDPKRALDEPNNEIAQSLKKKHGPKIRKLLRPRVSVEVTEQIAREVVGGVPELNAAPLEIQKAFLDVIVEGSRVHTIWTLYETIRNLTDFIANPLGWLTNWLPDWLEDKVKDALKFYAKERVYDWIGAGRIGCHSLLAKDHGLEPLYKHQKQCATAVHWYIVKTLLRWSAMRTEGYVDWLELLEYFLRNPLPPDHLSYREVRAFIPVTLLHTVTRGEQLGGKHPQYSLEQKYRRTAMNPSRFTWRTIADANFGTARFSEQQAQRTINQILRDKAWGVPVTPPNYAFKAGLRILIPGQKMATVFRIPVGNDPIWFKQVLENDQGWKVFPGFKEPDSGQEVPPLQHHSLVLISLAELQKLIVNGKRLRRMARQAYRPNARARCP